MAKIALNVDGKSHTIEADNDMPLLYALRDDLGLRNPKFGCGLAQCGACTVIIDGVAVRSCVTPVDWLRGLCGTAPSPDPNAADGATGNQYWPSGRWMLFDGPLRPDKSPACVHARSPTSSSCVG